jgi:hypothetical protein
MLSGAIIDHRLSGMAIRFVLAYLSSWTSMEASEMERPQGRPPACSSQQVPRVGMYLLTYQTSIHVSDSIHLAVRRERGCPGDRQNLARTQPTTVYETISQGWEGFPRFYVTVNFQLRVLESGLANEIHAVCLHCSMHKAKDHPSYIKTDVSTHMRNYLLSCTIFLAKQWTAYVHIQGLA